MTDENTPNHGIESRPGESPLDWLTRIAPEEWDVAENGYDLVLQSGDRRVVVDPLADRTVWQERIETGDDAFGDRWIQCEVIEGSWHVQTTAGLLLWGVSDVSETDPTSDDERRDERNASEVR